MLSCCGTNAIFCIIFVCFEAIVRQLNDVSNNLLKCAEVPGIRLPFNYNP